MTLTGTISEKRDAGRKLGFFIPHLHSMPPLGGSPSEYRHNVWYQYEKTRTVALLLLLLLNHIQGTNANKYNETT